MTQNRLTDEDLKRELDDFRDRLPTLADDHLFVLWFLRAYLTENDQEAEHALCGGSNDKGIDAILIDRDSKTVFVVQGKYRQKLGDKTEKHADVTGFAQRAQALLGDEVGYQALLNGLAPDVHERLAKARRYLLREKYKLWLVYVTTGKVSKALAEEATKIAKPAVFDVVDWKRVLIALDYWLRDAPPVRSLDLVMEHGSGVDIKGNYHRYDRGLNIESWVCSMTCQSVAEMYEIAGARLFALNIRGYLGSKIVNQEMEKSLKKEPEYFWYYNNGLTIICDGAENVSKNGRDVLRITHPQVINGQQTTRTIAKIAAANTKASVTVRVIRIAIGANGKANHLDALVPQIVKATNWQNPIITSDLIANDRRQIEIQRQLRKMGYWYLRKRQSLSEARREVGSRHFRLVPKGELAQAVAGCNLDPAIGRRGREKLFEGELYGQLFTTSDPYYYLCRYWLAERVKSVAYGDRRRGYAKWMVLNFVWAQLEPLVTTHSGAERFRHAWESHTDALWYLWDSIDTVYKSALQFYADNHGKGTQAVDVVGFFKRANLHHQFASYWRSPNNARRQKFNKQWSSFEQALKAEA